MNYRYNFTRRFLFYFLGWVILAIPAFAQSVNLGWSVGIGGSGVDQAYSITAEYPGYVYTVGKFSGTVDFDPGPGVANLVSSGSTDGFILKLDTSGAFIWARQIGGASAQQVNSVVVDSNGGVYVTGLHAGTTDLNPGLSTQLEVSNGSNDIFVLHVDSAGDFVWGKSFGGSGSDAGNAVVIDSLGNVYVTGSFVNTVDFDPGPGVVSLTYNGLIPATGADFFLVKFDINGDFLWVNSVGGTKNDVGLNLAIDQQGNVSVVGIFEGTLDFDPGVGVLNLSTAPLPASSVHSNDIFVANYSGTGNLNWAKNFGDAPSTNPHLDLAIDNLGNTIIAGLFYETADFDPGPGVQNLTSNGGGDIFINKFDGSGNFIWAKGIGGTATGLGIDFASGIEIDQAGNVYLCGAYGSSPVDFDPGSGVFNLLTGTGAKNYALKLSSLGDFVWARKFGGGITSTNANGIACYFDLDELGNLYFAGLYGGQQLADFDPGPSVVSPNFGGSLDAYILKLSQNGCGVPTYSTGSITVCDSILLGGDEYSIAGNYTVVFLNSTGCDSISNIAVTVNYSSSSSHSYTACDSFAFNGNVYATSGIHLDTFMNAVGCDSIVELNLTLLYSSFDTLVHATCDSLVVNGTAYYTTGFHSQNYTAANGCDSFVVLDLTILSGLDTIPQAACYSFVYNGATYTSGGYYLHSFTSVNSCDSVVVLNLAINTVDVAVTNTGSSLLAGATNATYQWLDCNGLSPIPGETGQIFVPMQTGSYAVVVTQSGCTDTSVCLVINDVREISSIGFDLEIYPNPATRLVNVVSDVPLNNAIVRIRDIEGRLLITRYGITGNSFKIDVESLAAGIYFIEIEMERQIFREKCIKL